MPWHVGVWFCVLFCANVKYKCQACGGQMRHLPPPYMEAIPAAGVHMDCMRSLIVPQGLKIGRWCKASFRKTASMGLIVLLQASTGRPYSLSKPSPKIVSSHVILELCHPCAGSYTPTNRKMWA